MTLPDNLPDLIELAVTKLACLLDGHSWRFTQPEPMPGNVEYCVRCGVRQ